MKKIFSKVDPTKLLHIVRRLEDIEDQQNFREDVIDPDHFIQCSTLKMEIGKTFKPHKHIEKARSYDAQIAQESWIVIRGAVKCFFYDIDDTIIATEILLDGDASFTLYGGHNYEILVDGTIVYEYKTGPYEGQALDKKFIE
jgi:hypothetical protein